MQKNIISVSFITIFSFINLVGNVFGGGFDNTAIGMKGMSMGNGLTGLADDASAVYFNPAGLVFLEKNVWNGELYTYFAYTSFKYKANYNDGSDHKDESNSLMIIPGFFISRTYDKWAFGYGFYTPYAGGGTDYSNFQSTGSGLEAAAAFPSATIAAAYRISPKLSVGVGLSMYMGMMMESKNIFIYDPAGPVVTPYKSKFDEIYAGYGGHIGIFYRPSEELGIGLTVRSEVPIEMDGWEKVEIGGSLVRFGSETEFTLPWSFDVGVGYKPSPKLTLGCILSQRFYSNMDEMEFDIAGDIKTHYKDIWFAGIGVEYKVKDDLALKAGVKYLEGASNDKGLRADTVDVDTIHPTVGFAYDMSESKEFNMSIMYNAGIKERHNNQTFDQDHLSLIIGLRF
ncbi:MAG: outer membrane protein transport protein [Deltaproteobacteria bacterium]|nr:outer membrane protein transport protein [Deltaproteobacteria bacterium]